MSKFEGSVRLVNGQVFGTTNTGYDMQTPFFDLNETVQVKKVSSSKRSVNIDKVLAKGNAIKNKDDGTSSMDLSR